MAEGSTKVIGAVGGRRAALQALAAAAAAGSDDDGSPPAVRAANTREGATHIRAERAGAEALTRGTSRVTAGAAQTAGASGPGAVGVQDQSAVQENRGAARSDRQAALLAKLQAARANDSEDEDLL
jgi:hypothetical protein